MIFRPAPPGSVLLCIEIDAVGLPDKHIAVGYAVMLGHAHADAVAVQVDHGQEVAGRVDPVVDRKSIKFRE